MVSGSQLNCSGGTVRTVRRCFGKTKTNKNSTHLILQDMVFLVQKKLHALYILSGCIKNLQIAASPPFAGFAMGRRFSTATAVSEVWDSHQATHGHPPPAMLRAKGWLQDGGSNEITKSIKVSWWFECPFCIQSEMMILRYLCPFCIQSEMMILRYLCPFCIQSEIMILFNMNTPVHTVLIHLPTLCYGSRKQARVAVRLWRVSL